MKKIAIAPFLLAVLICTVALAECAGGNPNCNGASLTTYENGTRTYRSSCGYGGWPVDEVLISEHHSAANR